MKFTRTRLAMKKGKICIVQHQDDTPEARERRLHRMRFVFGKTPCKRRRVCSGINCPCVPNTYSKQEQLAAEQL